MLPIMPNTLFPSNSFPQIVPMGAAKFVTKEIIANKKNIAMIAMSRPLELFFVSMTISMIGYCSLG